MICSLIRDRNALPKKELHSSLQVSIQHLQRMRFKHMRSHADFVDAMYMYIQTSAYVHLGICGRKTTLYASIHTLACVFICIHIY